AQLQEIGEQLKALLDCDHSLEKIKDMIEGCIKIGRICERDLSTKTLMDALEKIDSLNALQDLIDERSPVPLEIVRLIRQQIEESLLTIEKMAITLVAVDEAERRV
ncbi:MAG: hypothetical protein KA310_15085, partial [Pseudomonadales bacterium]|nr:hypothetical protein [Pseudomonadales bacterium]